MSEPIPLYGRDIGRFTMRWCPACDSRKTVPHWRDICPDCSCNLMPIPERQPIYSGIHDLRGLYEIMERREVSQFLLSRELRITRSRISRLARGEQLATQQEAERLADVSGVKIGHLTGEYPLPNRQPLPSTGMTLAERLGWLLFRESLGEELEEGAL